MHSSVPVFLNVFAGLSGDSTGEYDKLLLATSDRLRPATRERSQRAQEKLPERKANDLKTGTTKVSTLAPASASYKLSTHKV